MSMSAQTSMDELILSAKSLPIKELDQFVQRLLILRAERNESRLSKQESELLQSINKAIPEALQQRYDLLKDKEHQNQLSRNEHQEMLKLIEEIEYFDAKRLQNLVILAKLRKISLNTVMQDLGIQAKKYV